MGGRKPGQTVPPPKPPLGWRCSDSTCAIPEKSDEIRMNRALVDVAPLLSSAERVDARRALPGYAEWERGGRSATPTLPRLPCPFTALASRTPMITGAAVGVGSGRRSRTITGGPVCHLGDPFRHDVERSPLNTLPT